MVASATTVKVGPVTGLAKVPLTLENRGTGLLAWLATWDRPWLKVVRRQGNECTDEVRYQGVALGVDLGGKPSQLCVAVDTMGLPPGVHYATIAFQTLYAATKVLQVRVEVTVPQSPSPPVSDGKPRWFYPFIPEAQKAFGMPGDIPVPADYNGDGRVDMAVFRPSEGVWIVHGGPVVRLGAAGDIPVPADYNGDGRVDMAVFRPSQGIWIIGGGMVVKFGIPGDIPVPADYNGDGRADIAVFRPFPSDWPDGMWFIWGGGVYKWGIQGDIPVPADYFGQGKVLIGVFRAEGNGPSVVGTYQSRKAVISVTQPQ